MTDTTNHAMIPDITRLRDAVNIAGMGRPQLEALLAALDALTRELERSNHRIQIMREGILEARSEGCLCDFHIYGEDQELTTPEALDAYCTLEQRNTRLECESAAQSARIATLEEAVKDSDARFEKLAEEYCDTIERPVGLVIHELETRFPGLKVVFKDGREIVRPNRAALAPKEAQG